MSASKTAVVTGASRGIGKAVAIGLANDGWSTALISRSEDSLQALVSELPCGDNQIHVPFAADVSDAGKIKHIISNVEQDIGPIELLFNNAGIHSHGTHELSKEEFERLFEVNVTGAWNLIKEVAPRMKERCAGAIINLSSIGGVHGFAGVGAYCSTKFALCGLNESLFRELSEYGIKVTSINPSWVDTKMAEHASFSGDKMIQPEDIYQTVKYILSLSPTACIKEITIHCKENIN